MNLIHPEDLPELEAAFLNPSSDSLQKARPQFRIKDADGSWKWLSVHFKPAREENKDRLLCIIQDITEQKLSENELAQKAEEREIFLNASQSLTSSLDLPTVLQRITEHATELIRLDSGALYLLKDESLYLGATTPPLPPDFPEFLRFANIDDHPHIRKTVTEKNPQIIEDTAEAELSESEQMVINARNLKSLLYIPLISGPSVTGVLILGTTSSSRMYSEEEINISRALAGQAAIAIQNARLLDESRMQRSRSEFLALFSHNISKIRDFTEVRLNIVRSISEFTHHACILTLLPEERNETKISVLFYKDPSASENLRSYLNHRPRILDALFRASEKNAAEMTDLPETDPAQGRAQESFQFAGMISAPIQIEGRLSGALLVMREFTGPGFNEDDRIFITNLADRAGHAIENALHYIDLENKIAERTRDLQTSEERYRKIVNSSPDGIAVLINEQIVFANPSLTELICRGETSLIGRSIRDLMLHDSEDASIFEDLKNKAQSTLRTVKFICDDGAAYDMEILITPVIFSGEEALQIIARNVTERKQNEMRLIVQNLAADTISRASSFDSAISGILTNICKTLDWDHGRLWEVDSETQTIHSRIHVHLSEQTDANILNSSETDDSAEIAKKVWLHNETSWIPDISMESSLSPESIEKKSNYQSTLALPIISEGNTIGVIQFFSRKTMPRDNNLLSTLGSIAANISQFLERLRVQNRLIEAKQEADRANKAKSQFLSRMSHELRTPLNAILGFSEILQMENLDDEQQNDVNMIQKSGRHLLEMINEILDLSRIEAGRLRIDIESVPVKILIKDAVDLIRPLSEKRDITISMGIPSPDDLYILSDWQYARQILINLLSNAVKYNRPGGKIHIAGNLKNDGNLRISISDTGSGISPEQMNRLFIPFERLDESSGEEGTGLGLALTKGLVEGMGGSLGVESIPGEGSTFWFEFRLTTHEPKEVIAETTEKILADDLRNLSGVILYVEDNLANIKLMEAILKKLPGIELINAMQGRLALDLARTHKPDLILLDLQLPDINGKDVYNILRSHNETRNIPVIILTAEASHIQQEHLLSLGVSKYISKPISVSALYRLLRDFFQNKEASA